MRKLEQRMTDVERAEHAAFGKRFAYIPELTEMRRGPCERFAL